MQNGGRDREHLGVGARNGPSGFQAADGGEPPGVTKRKTVVAWIEDGLDADGHGHVKGVANGNAIETRLGDANHLKRIAVQRQPFSNHGGVAGKVSLPEGVADVCSRKAATWLVILRTKQPPQNRLDAKEVKEIAADTDAFCYADLAAGGQIEPRRTTRRFRRILPGACESAPTWQT